MNDIHILCKYQGELFKYSINYLDCSSRYFFKKFMNSSIAERMDKISFLNESIDYPALLDDLKKETDLTQGYIKFDPEIMEWVGYLCKYWTIKYNISSSRIFKYIHLADFERLYEPYHSLDVEEAISRISEARNIKYTKDWDEILEIAMKVSKEYGYF